MKLIRTKTGDLTDGDRLVPKLEVLRAIAKAEDIDVVDLDGRDCSDEVMNEVVKWGEGRILENARKEV